MRYLFVAVAIGLVACATGEPAGGGDEVDAAKTSEPDAAVSDGPTIDTPTTPIDAPTTPIDAPIDSPPSATPDTCAAPPDITAMAMMSGGVTLTGSTVGYANDINPPVSCTTYTTNGPDAVYALNLTAGRTITVVATPTTIWDISLMLVTPCATLPTCLAADDSGFAGTVENVTYTTTAAGVVYVVVDSFQAITSGPYSLNVRVQ